jgi:hypothetical protein
MAALTTLSGDRASTFAMFLATIIVLHKYGVCQVFSCYIYRIMLKRLAIFGVLAFASIGFLSCQGPPLGTPEQGVAKPNSGKSGQTQGNVQNGRQSSPETVLPSLPKLTTSNCDEACQQGRQNLAIQRNLELFTGLLVLVGGLQAGTMVWQGIFLRRTWRDIHTQAGTMESQGRIMEKQAVALERQTVLQFRPKLVVRSVMAKNAEITFSVSNTGGTRAQLMACHVFAIARGKKSAEANLVEQLPIAKVIFEAGQVRLYRVPITQDIQEEIDDLDSSFRAMGTIKSLPNVYCGGLLRYIDDVGIQRDTGFERIYAPKHKRFTPQTNAEGEYAD